MKSLDDALKEVVEIYAEFSPGESAYHDKNILAAKEKQQVEAHLITIFSQYVTQQGLGVVDIDHHAKKLRALFHTDKYKRASPEIKWLEYTLSNGAINGFCFKLIDHCSAEIKKKPLEEKVFYTDISDISDVGNLIYSLQKKRASPSATLTKRALIDSIISLIESIDNYNHTTDLINSGWLGKIINSMPYITSGFCIGLYLNELALLYALTFSASKGGKWLENRDSQFWKTIGKEMQAYSEVLSYAASTLITYFVELNVRTFNKVYYIGITTCESIYNAISAAPVVTSYSPASMFADEEDNACPSASGNCVGCSSELVLAAPDLLVGRRFQSLELKFVALNLERYLDQQAQQFFACLRKGNIKSQFVQETLLRLQEIDKMPLGIEEKLKKAKSEIDALARVGFVNVKGSQARASIEMAKYMVNAIGCKSEEDRDEKQKLLAYDGSSLF